jgi:hypothetical protein
MKKRVLSVVAMSSFLFTLAIAGSAIDLGRMKANIPFDFTVGKTKLPAGSYIVDSAVVRGCLQISAADRSKNLFVSVFGGETSKKPSQAKLVFHRYGDQYFLWQVWNEGGTEAMRLPKSRAERELASQSKYLAQNETEPELVVVMAQ